MAPSKGSRGKKDAEPLPPPVESTFFRDKLKSRLEPVKLNDTPRPLECFKTALTPAETKLAEKQRKAFLASPMVQLLMKSEEITAREAEVARLANATPLHKEDAAMWKKLPPVPHPFGGPPLVRKAIKSKEEGANKFLDWFRQFQFGLWGYRQRPYPYQKPADVQQALGFKWLDNRYYDFAMKSGGFYYKDRLGRTRGPMEIVTLKTAWAAGIVDKNTFIWGEDMDEFAPLGMVYGMERAVNTPDVALATWGTKVMHRVAQGRNPSSPAKGHEMRSYNDLQAAALMKRDRENTILKNHGGTWPGERIPSHVLGMWAGGSQLTNWLEGNDKVLPDKFISKKIRMKLAEKIPGLRPWEILDYEQFFDFCTFRNQFYRAPLGSLTTPIDYVKEYNTKMWRELGEATRKVKDAARKREQAREIEGNK